MIARIFNAIIDMFVEWGEHRAAQHLRRGQWY